AGQRDSTYQPLHGLFKPLAKILRGSVHVWCSAVVRHWGVSCACRSGVCLAQSTGRRGGDVVQAAPAKDDDGEGGFGTAPLTVAGVARTLGVAASTLRTWDRRYGLGP